MDIAVNQNKFTPVEGVEMSKNLDYTILFDIYSPLLTDKQRETLDLYYNEDLSLGEIAESTGITRQAVMGCIQKCEQRLDELERDIGLAKRSKKISELLNLIEAQTLGDPVCLDCVFRIRQLL